MLDQENRITTKKVFGWVAAATLVASICFALASNVGAGSIRPAALEAPITHSNGKFGIVEMDGHEYVVTDQGGICHKYNCKYD